VKLDSAGGFLDLPRLSQRSLGPAGLWGPLTTRAKMKPARAGFNDLLKMGSRGFAG
jgi:hypothetical protein